MDKTSKDKFSPKSSFIMLAEYDPQSRMMTLTFRTGSQFNYLNVFESTWLSFKQAENHGVYYSRLIKGRMPGVPVMKKDIGRRRSTPLKKLSQPRRLNTHGLNIGNASKRPTRTPGLIPSAFGRNK